MQNEEDDDENERDDDGDDTASGDDGPPNIFGGAGDDVPTVPDGPRRNVRADILAAVNAAERPLTVEQVQEEIRAGGYVAEGPTRSALDALHAAGAIDLVMLGDPMVAHYRRKAAATDTGLLVAVCIALAGIPDDRVAGAGVRSAHEIAAALEASSGGSFNAEMVEPLLDILVQRKVLEVTTVQRVMPGAPVDGYDGDAEPSDAPTTVAVTGYGFPAGMQHQLLAPGFAALIDPDAAAVAWPAGAAGAVEGSESGVAAAKAAVAGVYATRLIEAEKTGKAERAARAAAEKRAATAEQMLATARRRLEDRGLHGVFDDALAMAEAAVEPDERGRPVRYEKRVPVNTELRALFHRDGKAIRREIEGHEARVDGAKAVLKAIDADVKEKIAVLKQQQRDMDAADDGGQYLLVVAEAYKLYDEGTGRTAVHDYATRAFVCWDDPADLPRGSQPTLPGLDATNTATGAAPAGEAKPPQPKRKPRKPKGGEAANDSDDGAEDGDATGASETPPQPKGPTPGAAPVGGVTVDEAVANALALGSDSAFKIVLALGPLGTSNEDVIAVLRKLAAAGNGAARAALLKSGETVAPKVDAATAAATAANDAKTEAAAAVVPQGSGSLSLKALKPDVAEVVKAAGAAGLLWREASGQVTSDVVDAYAAKVGMRVTPSLPVLVQGAVEALAKSAVLVEHVEEDGAVRLFHAETAPKKGKRGGKPKAA